jgi:hypothetical protein
MPRQIPYGQSNFEKIILEDYIYVDKTKYIEMLENESNDYNFLIRPRKFGKSLFLSMLWNYYDITQKDKFEQLFGNLYIGKHPTGKQNSLFVIRFSFAGIDTMSEEDFKKSFTSAIRMSVRKFFVEHRTVLDNYALLDTQAGEMDNVRECIEFALKVIAEQGCKAYIIIDEYDHFANDLISIGTRISNEQYKSAIWANGVVRDFYETVKDATQTVVDRIFITGVTPIMLDDITSGFNISNNISIDREYNEIIGFTQEEVGYIIQESGVNKNDINVNIEYFYDGYSFHPDAEHKLYNSSMIGYYLNRVLKEGKSVEYLIDDNLKTDYGKIKGLLSDTQNVLKLEHILSEGNIKYKLVPKFSIDKIHDRNYFLSMLYFFGLLTVGKDSEGSSVMKIPNYSVKTMYWDYIQNLIKDRNPDVYFDSTAIINALDALRTKNDIEPFMKFICDNILNKLSNRDFQNFDEKHLKMVLLSPLFMSNYYLPISEIENSGGYSDIYLKRGNLHPNTEYEWVWELKYVKEKDKNNTVLIKSKKDNAIAQLKHYKESNFFKDRTDVRYICILFVGDGAFEIDEVK